MKNTPYIILLVASALLYHAIQANIITPTTKVRIADNHLQIDPNAILYKDVPQPGVESYHIQLVNGNTLECTNRNGTIICMQIIKNRMAVPAGEHWFTIVQSLYEYRKRNHLVDLIQEATY
jgi:hypothetical protein